MVKSDSTKRAFWKLARVEELLISKDGKVRAARVKVSNAERNPVCIRRVIQHLVPLEIKAKRRIADSEEESGTTNEPGELEEDILNDNEISNGEGRPRRKAAVQGEEIRRLSDMQYL